MIKFSVSPVFLALAKETSPLHECYEAWQKKQAHYMNVLGFGK